MWISAPVRTVGSKKIMENDDMGNQLEGCSESTWRALIRVCSLACHPLIRQNTNPGDGTHNNIQTNGTHSAYYSIAQFVSLFDFYDSADHKRCVTHTYFRSNFLWTSIVSIVVSKRNFESVALTTRHPSSRKSYH
jgi:hypothetical protein